MILGFSTKFPAKKKSLSGNPTHFVYKILSGLEGKLGETFVKGLKNAYKAKFGVEEPESLHPKIHTIRSGGRWKEGNFIDFYINTRTKNMYAFAPRLKCTGTQSITIHHSTSNPGMVRIEINGIVFYEGLSYVENDQAMLEFAKNDGFESVRAFFDWFDEDLEDGVIVHWTDRRYNIIKGLTNKLM